MKLFKESYKMTFRNLGKSFYLFVPFFLLAFIEIVGLVIIYFAPQWPLRRIFAPIIRAFLKEEALHYPYHLFYLPKMFKIVQIVSEIIFGSILTGITISRYNQSLKNMHNRFGTNLKIAFNRYLSLLCYSFILFVFIFCFEKFSGKIITNMLVRNKNIFLGINQFGWMIILPILNIIVSIILQMILIYVPIVIIIETKRFWKSLIGSVKILFQNFLSTFLIFIIPILVYLLVMYSRVFLPKNTFLDFPEINIVFTLIEILTLFIVNVVITVGTTSLYVLGRKNGKCLDAD